MDLDASLHHLILDLYGDAQTASVAEFSLSMMTRLKRMVCFDSGGSILLHLSDRGDAVIAAQTAFNVVPDKPARRAEFIGPESYSVQGGLASRDPLLRRSMAQPDQVHTLASGTLGDRGLKEYARRTESLHALNFVTRKTERTIASLSFWRSGAEHAFSARDVARSSILIPHALQAMAINRQLAAGPFAGRRQSGILIAEQNGLIHHVDDHSILLLRREYPDWLSHHLPEAMVSGFLSDGAQRYVGKHIIASLRRQGALLVIGMQGKEAGLKLTPAELRVVEKIVEHGTYKEAARQLGVSPRTVRNQLQAIYQKLGINSKSELVKALEP